MYIILSNIKKGPIFTFEAMILMFLAVAHPHLKHGYNRMKEKQSNYS